MGQASRAARKMMDVRGYAVIGILAGNHISVGDLALEWAGRNLEDGDFLRVTSRTDIADWDEQFKALFPEQEDKNPRDGTFWRAVLERESENPTMPTFVSEERERCARIAENYAGQRSGSFEQFRKGIAAAIRKGA